MNQNSLQPAPISASIEQLYNEIRQINEQYKREVPKKRRPWPTSIQSRILELWKLGVSCHTIATQTGLPAQTMYSWRERIKKTEGHFLPIPISQRGRKKGALLVHRNSLSQLEGASEVKCPTVIVILPNGTRIEGLLPEAAASFLRAMQ